MDYFNKLWERDQREFERMYETFPFSVERMLRGTLSSSIEKKYSDIADPTTIPHDENLFCAISAGRFDMESWELNRKRERVDLIIRSSGGREIHCCNHNALYYIQRKSQYPSMQYVYDEELKKVFHIPTDERILNDGFDIEIGTEEGPVLYDHFSSEEFEILKKLKEIDQLSLEKLVAWYFVVRQKNCFVRVGPPKARFAFDVASIIKQYIYLRMGKPLVKEAYFENIKNEMALYCYFCRKRVNLSCHCSPCEYLRSCDDELYSIQKEKKGHRSDCRRVKSAFL